MNAHNYTTANLMNKVPLSTCWNAPLENISSNYKSYIDLNAYLSISKLQMINVYTIGAINNN